MYVWILFPVQSEQLSLLCPCQRNWFLIVSRLSDDVRASPGGICLQTLLCVTLLLPRGQECTQCCRTMDLVFMWTQETPSDPNSWGKQSCNASTAIPCLWLPCWSASTAPLGLVTWPWLVIPSPSLSLQHSPPCWGAGTGPGCEGLSCHPREPPALPVPQHLQY